MAVGADEYRAQIHALLPRGAAWPRERGTTLDGLVGGVAAEYARADAAAEGLLGEIDPRDATVLLPDWERLLGLPDDCSPASTVLDERRRAAHFKLTTAGDVSRASIIATAAALGYAVQIQEHNQALASAIPGIDTSGGRWRYVWWIHVESAETARHFTVESGVDEPLVTYPDLTEVICRLKGLVPAHTYAVFLSGQAPTADAGADQSVAAGAAVSLDGTGSSDPDGTISTYAWTQVSGDTVALTDANTATPDFTAPSANSAQVLRFRLTVVDDDGVFGVDEVEVAVAAVPQPPTASAGADQSVAAGASVSLDGSASSDPDGTISTYAWTQIAGDTVALTGANTATPRFTAPRTNSAQTLRFRLTVTDNDGSTATDDVDVAVAAQQAPTANAGADQSVAAGAAVSLDGSASSDPDGTISTYAWTQLQGDTVALTDADTATPDFTAPATLNAQTLRFRLTVTDNEGATDTDTVDVAVAANQAPSASAGADRSVAAGAAVSLDGSASSDPDGTISTYAWTQLQGDTVALADADTATPDFTAPRTNSAQTLRFRLTVTDNHGATATDDVDVAVAAQQAPTANAGAGQTVAAGAAVSLDGTGSSDPDGTISTYAWTQVSGVTVALADADTATPDFTAPVPVNVEVLSFRLTVTDNDGATATDDVLIYVANNMPPTANAGADRSVGNGATVNLDGTASSDPDDGIASYAWTQISGDNVTLADADTATPSFVAPATAQTLRFRLTVTDTGGLTATDDIDIEVTVNQAPTASAGADQIVDAGAAVNLDGSASSDPDGSISTYAWTQLQGDTVALTGAGTATPSFTAPRTNAAQTLRFRLTVTDNEGATATDDVDVAVAAQQAPTASAGADQSVAAGAAVSLDGSASSDPDGTISTYAWTQVSGDTVALTDADTATPDFTAPATDNAQTLTFRLTVTDNEGGTATDDVDVAVAARPLTAVAGPDQTVVQGATIQFDGSGSYGGATTYFWSTVAGQTLDFTSAGVGAMVSAVAPSDWTGTIRVRLRVFAADGVTVAEDTVDITVEEAPVQRTVAMTATGTLDARTSGNSRFLDVVWASGRPQVPAALLETGVTTLYMNLARLWTQHLAAQGQSGMRLDFSTTDTGATSTNQDLDNEWENLAVCARFTAGTHTIEVPGMTSTRWGSRDSTNPYQVNVSFAHDEALRTAIHNFINDVHGEATVPATMTIELFEP